MGTRRGQRDIGDVVREQGTVKVLGTLTDPAAVTFTVKAPDGTLIMAPAGRVGLGVYYGDVVCQQPGTYWWRMAGSPDASFGEEGYIKVRRSPVLDT